MITRFQMWVSEQFDAPTGAAVMIFVFVILPPLLVLGGLKLLTVLAS